MPNERLDQHPPQNSNQNSDQRQYAPATERNRQPILAILQQMLPPSGTVLEISSGTGEHITFFAPRMPHLQWIPSEPMPLSRASIEAWAKTLPASNLQLPPLNLDVSQHPWPIDKSIPINAIVNINMIHIATWEMCTHLMTGAEQILPSSGVLYLYGPFQQNAQQTSPSNEAFDRSLRDRNPDWGIRDLEAVEAIAQQHSLRLEQVIPMPANNLSLIFRRIEAIQSERLITTALLPFPLR